MSGIGIMSRVRLVAAAREQQRDLAHAVGVVHGMTDRTALVSWPDFRSQHKLGDLELAEP